jgi:glycosyltransferase involved in cell wall biosynthesis
MAPRVSVVVPTRDRLPLLRRALGGVDAQGFRDFEVIVVDDGSSDGTSEWIRSNRADIRLLASTESAGASAARNRALPGIRGELVAFLDSDDLWAPSYLEEQVAHLDRSPEAHLSYTDHLESHPDGRSAQPNKRTLVPDSGALERLLAEAFIHTLSSVVCRTDSFDRFGRFDESLVIVHDFDWYLRVLTGGGMIAHLPRPLVERRVPGGLVTAHRRWFSEDSAVITKALETASGQECDRTMIRAYRAMFFARVGLAKGDLPFGLARLGEALGRSPRWSIRLTRLSLARRARGRRDPQGELRSLPAGAAR